RDYSLQEPADLRIRRRLSPFPDVSFMEAFKTKAQSFIHTLSAAQSILGVCKVQSQAQVLDSRTATLDMKAKVDIGITSPPYATALPYIDTQRLSLVWLDLCSPSELKALEAHLTGSREFARGEKAATNEVVFSNAFNLPEDVYG